MNLIYVTSSLPHGPGEAFVLSEVLELVQQGHKVWMVPLYPRGPLIHAEARQLLQTTMVEPPLSPRVISGAVAAFCENPRASLRTLRWMFRERHPRMAAKNLVAWVKGLWLGRITLRQDINHIHAHWAATTATMAMVASEFSGIPYSITAHRWDIVENNMLQFKVGKAAFIRFISQSGLQLATERVPDANLLNAKTRIIHMGVRPPDLRAPIRLQAQSHYRLLCPASLIPVKGHSYLIEAIRLLREQGLPVYLELAGDGPLRSALEYQVQSSSLGECISFLGHLPHDRLIDRYEAGTVACVVLPSVDLGGGEHEGIPVSLMEAMGYGIPVIATNTGGIPELLGENAGILVPPCNAVELARAIGHVLTAESVHQKIGESGRIRVQEEFSLFGTVNRLVELFGGSRQPERSSGRAI